MQALYPEWKTKGWDDMNPYGWMATSVGGRNAETLGLCIVAFIRLLSIVPHDRERKICTSLCTFYFDM